MNTVRRTLTINIECSRMELTCGIAATRGPTCKNWIFDATTTEKLRNFNSYCGRYAENSPGRWWKCHKRGSRVHTRQTVNALAVVHNSILTSAELLENEQQQQLLNVMKVMQGQLKTGSIQSTVVLPKNTDPISCEVRSRFFVCLRIVTRLFDNSIMHHHHASFAVVEIGVFDRGSNCSGLPVFRICRLWNGTFVVFRTGLVSSAWQRCFALPTSTL